MKMRDLMEKSKQNYRKSGFISHVIFLFLTLLAASFMMLCLFFVDLFLIIVPLIVIPILFACQVIVILLREEQYLTFRGFINCFTNYFTGKFASTFRVLKSALFSLVVYLVFLIIYSLTLNLSLYSVDYMGYHQVVDEITTGTLAGQLDIDAILNNHKAFFNQLLIFTNVPNLFVFAFTFTYLTSLYSVGLFDRLDKIDEPGKLNKLAQERVMSKYRKEYVTSFLKLNWPLLLLFAIGFTGGAFIGYFTLGSYTGVFTLGVVLALFLSFGLFGPFYLANNEAIYQLFKDRYIKEKEFVKGKYALTLEDLVKQYEKESEDKKKDSNES